MERCCVLSDVVTAEEEEDAFGLGERRSGAVRRKTGEERPGGRLRKPYSRRFNVCVTLCESKKFIKKAGNRKRLTGEGLVFVALSPRTSTKNRNRSSESSFPVFVFGPSPYYYSTELGKSPSVLLVKWVSSSLPPETPPNHTARIGPSTTALVKTYFLIKNKS